MIINGELINASRKEIGPAIETQDAQFIQNVAADQAKAGADYIDVNAGVFVDREARYMKWLVETVQSAVDKPCSIDSPDPKVIETVLAVHKGTPMINSISLEKTRYESLIPVVAGTEFKVVALCMSDKGMPETVEDRMSIADKLINRLMQNNVKIENIYVDPLVQPISVSNNFGIEFLNTIEKIVNTFEGIHTICGLSNISFGLPNRTYLNGNFMAMAINRGLDGAIVNPLDKNIMASILAAEVLCGKDEYCTNYLKAHRAGIFEEFLKK